jgi:hypothetical protein
LAVAEPVREYVVPAGVWTVTMVGAVVVELPFCGRTLSMLKPVALTAVTFPKAPSPPNPLPPGAPPAPGLRVRPGFGTPGGPVGSPAAPGGRPPAIPAPPRTEHLPFSAGEISTVAATTGPSVARGAAVGVVLPAAGAGRAARAWTHAPTTTSDRFAATVLVNFVPAE